MPETQPKKGRPTPKAPQNSTSKAKSPADRLRAQHYRALLDEAKNIEDVAQHDAFDRMGTDTARSIVYDVLVPALDEAEAVRHTAKHFAQTPRESVSV